MTYLRRPRGNMRLQSGQVGERMAEQWFLNNGWHMVRTQPPVTILGMITAPMITVLKRFIPRLAAFGYMVIARLGKGGVPDYTGYIRNGVPHMHVDQETFTWRPLYVACEIKESSGDSMPASRLDIEQRRFMAALPGGSAWVGVFWTDTQTFTIHPFVEKGSYKKK